MNISDKHVESLGNQFLTGSVFKFWDFGSDDFVVSAAIFVFLFGVVGVAIDIIEVFPVDGSLAAGILTLVCAGIGAKTVLAGILLPAVTLCTVELISILGGVCTTKLFPVFCVGL